MNILLALIIFLIGFSVVNGLRLLHIHYSMLKLKSEAADPELSEPRLIQTAHRRSLPYVPVYYLLVWMACSSFYFAFHASPGIYRDAIFTGILWWLLTLLLETLLWVKARHKYRLMWKEMFINSQPWNSLAYYAILISPLAISIIVTF